MTAAAHREKDPVFWSAVIALGFAALALVRLTVIPKLYFDEIHYIPAARALLAGNQWLNQEHPMLGKELLAISLKFIGESPLGWRILPLLAGTGALYAFMRASWFATRTFFAPIATGILLATGFILFIQSRIAMLDIFMVAFAALAVWQVAAAMRQPETGRWRLALAGVAIGCSLASKWNGLPIAPLAGLIFLAWRVKSAGWRFAFTRRGAPVPGITLAEAALWLGVVPLAVYAATFIPALFITGSKLAQLGLIGQHEHMFALQESVVKPHPYQSTWRQWVIDTRPIWYFYEHSAGAQRGILMLGNPVTMILGLPAVAWCLWAGIVRKRHDALAIFALYALSIGFWIYAEKPIQFYYHYFLPSCFLLMALALSLDAMWRKGRRWLPLLVLGASCAMFAWFYPIISAAPLAGPQSFNHWMVLQSWR